MLDQLTPTVKPYCLFTTQERGRDHGPVYFMTTLTTAPRPKVSSPVEITRAQFDALTQLPGQWQEGDYLIDQEVQDYQNTLDGFLAGTGRM